MAPSDSPSFTEVEVGGKQYRIHKMTARSSARIYNQFSSAMIKFQSERQKGEEVAGEEIPDVDGLSREVQAAATVSFIWTLVSGELKEYEYTAIQNQCLSHCYQMVTAGGDSLGTLVPHPVLMKDGSNRWALKELEQDGVTVNRLVVETLKYNISPFFIDGVSDPVSRQPAVLASSR